MGLLPHTDITALHATLISAGLAESRDTLLAGLPHVLVAHIRHEKSHATQILVDLEALNVHEDLPDGTTPLAAWLENAVALTRDREPSKIFEAALAKLRSEAKRAPASPPCPSPPPPPPWKALAAVAAAFAVTAAVGLWAARGGSDRKGSSAGPLPSPAAPGPPPLPDRSAEPGSPTDMVAVSGNTFMMGSTPEEIVAAVTLCRRHTYECPKAIYEREQPVHEVTISRFLLDRTEVTYGAFVAWLARQQVRASGNELRLEGALVASTRESSQIVWSQNRPLVRTGAERHPAAFVTWFGAERYCRSRGLRLPTEAEWELAARGTERRLFPWGAAAPTCEGVVFARFEREACVERGEGASDVGTASMDVTPEGVHDLGGNVAEWVADEFSDRYDLSCHPRCVDPLHRGNASQYVTRGGRWVEWEESLRSAGRSRLEADATRADVGFRCAKSALPLR